MAEPENMPVNHLIVVGASAGGIETFSTLLRGLPAELPAPVVLAQHLDPNRTSHLSEIFQRRTSLPVTVVEDSMALLAGHVYVVPANYHVVISDGHVALEEADSERPLPSIDRLFASAASSYGERLFAVILTGSGSDGALGATMVKQAGGVVVIQNPQTARYPSMPAALPPHIVDFSVDVEEIGPLLEQLVTGDGSIAAAQPADAPIARILNYLNQQASIDFRLYKVASLQRRIQRRLAALKLDSLDSYAQYLETVPSEVGLLVNSLLIKVTDFFRDPAAYEYLKRDILPLLLARARNQELRLWSAGCATGEEPYSLAMLLADVLGPAVANWK